METRVVRFDRAARTVGPLAFVADTHRDEREIANLLAAAISVGAPAGDGPPVLAGERGRQPSGRMAARQTSAVNTFAPQPAQATAYTPSTNFSPS